ncbi:MAG TPA: chlorophyll synthesis pathway protein BchC [Sandaracinaceae bacterium LLY-WYZ-13_1]|nr:chlorophyll synthesis pathway protein BchC [Sandaracinaceae bacterium LLY-WYZ-13_1]
MDSIAVVIEGPRRLAVRSLPLAVSDPSEVLVDVEWSGISTGTERLFYTGEMPPFPGMGYPLVPGYETVGRVARADADSGLSVGDRVFVPGAACFGEVRGLFGGAASRLSVPADRLTRLDERLGERGVLLALAATAQHALAGGDVLPDLIVGHGVLGRLLARLAVAAGGDPVVWEKNPARADGARGYRVIAPEDDAHRAYRSIVDASGDSSLLDTLVARLGKGGEVVLAGFYTEKLAFTFPLAFMKEARLRIAAEFQPADLDAVLARLADGSLELDGLISHRVPFGEAADAYDRAFADPDCLKMVLDWRGSE